MSGCRQRERSNVHSTYRHIASTGWDTTSSAANPRRLHEDDSLRCCVELLETMAASYSDILRHLSPLHRPSPPFLFPVPPSPTPQRLSIKAEYISSVAN